MNKEAFTAAILEKIKADHRALLNTIGENEKSAAEAPSAMQSHSDTSKFQFGKLAEEDMKRAGILGEVIDLLERLKETKNDSVEVGALVGLQKDNNTSYFYITPEGGGGREISVEGVKVATISPGSPIGSALIGKKQGEEVVIQYPAGSKTFVVKELI